MIINFVIVFEILRYDQVQEKYNFSRKAKWAAKLWTRFS